ncbi:MAG TPA: DNA methyltransferase [Solirubrobacterales bacterium]|nr:DNA methyltransferase [Solirubrobacterales bacterium]
MRVLTAALRRQLETSVLAARRAGEVASAAALESLGVFAPRRPPHLDDEQAALRNGLRAKFRQLGRSEELLVAECAYEQWHRLLFARFLAENGLLLHPQYQAPVSLADCEDLAAELGEPDGWSVAARFAAEILPGIFRLDDPCVRLRFAPEGRQALEEILDAVPAETFLAGDALGWVYQFWQRDKKDEINDAERKIGGADLGPITQLFTEHYMVRFLLENSLGAWWAARHPRSPLLETFRYLRFDEAGEPAAGAFASWPDSVAELTVIDPCCGSGHFLVQAFSMLWRMRAEEEGLSPVEAQDAVLRDNLFGLELDPRCVQIAMFAVALEAWKAGGRWRQLPVPNIACSGIPVKAPEEDWKALADGDERLEKALGRLHLLFREADTLGSLIDPVRVSASGASLGQGSLEDVEWEVVAPLVERAARKGETGDPATAVIGSDVSALARAAGFLARRFTLVATNVPYLGMNRHGAVLAETLAREYPKAKADLATAFAERLFRLGQSGSALVLPQNWLYLASYRGFRQNLLASQHFRLLAKLGPGAFSTVSGEVVQPVLAVFGGAPAPQSQSYCLDVSARDGTEEKGAALEAVAGKAVRQADFGRVPGSRIVPEFHLDHPLLEESAQAYRGIGTDDGERFQRFFWEQPHAPSVWSPLHRTFSKSEPVQGRTGVIRWDEGDGPLQREARKLGNRPTRGSEAWGKRGVAINQTGNLAASLYDGDVFQSGVAAVIPTDEELLPAIWAFCRSQEYRDAVRLMDPKISVTNATLVQVPFDVERWRREADAAEVLEPPRDDPTQWVFDGRPERSRHPLQVAVARLVGYRWPEQDESEAIDGLADADGIVCLPSVAGEAPAAERVQQLLARAMGQTWSPAKARELLERAGSRKKSIEDWLRDEFFRQHCALFGNRPFAWHVWDGRRDGFAALVDYHRLDRKTLEKLTYTYLGQDWVERQRAAANDEVAGAEARLAAALELQGKLQLILDGEAPYDVYVRWKEMHEQPVGWDPDLNDGVRLNVRPFAEAGVLRCRFNVSWRKDRGKNPDGSERLNDLHLTLARKQEARAGRRAA